MLKESTRESLFARMREPGAPLAYLVDEISAAHMSACMLRRVKVSLNAISHDSAMGLVQRALDEGYNIKEVRASRRHCIRALMRCACTHIRTRTKRAAWHVRTRWHTWMHECAHVLEKVCAG